ncbi:DNA translocase FtsK [Gluconobacter wancherniae]|uniref:DNA translocase FtsK n=1 Tax=Gluconobacter wancherniae NBRC 103581 TaxID=656744 RepID=A0A511B0G1_9PROT|nr:DNA translocase FtsK [Gluconobacter wancherniae]MBF0854227.1 DNA translocase FtsK [Gluconobacter wancherniae]GBD57285.1 DNA translocase FtsK [Gluconobacter wancherniae NBRC 103581]GBR65519.1 cell division protein FtsK [Gluconobacter wancherniae NBRC 103581]GEK93940.1 DNA translocase FtsK [Gluconobacter wancherniae NBRC 103581]
MTPGLRSALRARLMELLGLGLLILAVGIGIALWSFNPHDPSFNTSTGTQPTNLLGRTGATISDGLVQWLGLGSGLPIVVLLAWAWRMVRHHGMSLPLLRIGAALLLLPAGATFIGTLQTLMPGLNVEWPTANGLGGQLGVSLAQKILGAAHDEIGAAGSGIAVLLVLLLMGILMPLAMGLQWREWQAMGRGVMMVGRQPFALAQRMNAPATSDRPAPDARLYDPQPGASGAPAADAAPMSFLRRNFGRSDPHTRPAPFIPQNTGWMQPPLPETEEALERPAVMRREGSSAGQTHRPGTEDRSPSTDGRTPPEEQENVPSNPYAERLAQIARQRDSQPAPARMDEDHEPEAEFVPQAQPSQEPRRGLFGMRMGDRPAQPAPRPAQQRPPAPAAGWVLPPLSLLRDPPPAASTGPSPEALQSNARLLESVLSDYGVQGTIGDIHAGPVVTLYELEPAPGIRSSRVIGLADDIARSLSVLSVRIATVPGRNVIGIEVPNAKRETVYFSELLYTPEWANSTGKLQIALGKDIAGVPVYTDLAKMPHLLVAGTTGSGKSVGVNAMILSLLYRLSPEECRLIMIDPKILELSIYDGIPHLMTPVVTEPAKAVSALKWTVQEMDRRYRLMAHLQVRNINGYNDRVRQLRSSGEMVTRRVQTGFDPETGKPVFDEQQVPLENLPYIVVVIDEMADLMMVAGKEIETAVQRLAQKARAAGIHVIMATQRPSVDVITGTIKANFPTRISFQVISKFDSRTILQEQGAEQLLGQGDMLFMQGGGRITRVHGPFVGDDEVEAVVADLRSKGEPIYNDDVVSGQDEEGPSSGGSGGGSGGNASETENSLFDQAVDIVAREGRASTSFIQRHLSIGYNRAAKLIDQMEKEGIIGPANHVGKREILVRRRTDEE